jgi:hypothetical protein
MLWAVFTRAVTLRFAKFPLPNCDRYTPSVVNALSVRFDAAPLYATYTWDAPLPPIAPEDAANVTCPPYPVDWIFAVLAVSVVPVLLLIDPAVAVTLTDVPLIAPLINALAPSVTLFAPVTVIDPNTDVTLEAITTFWALPELKVMFPPAVIEPFTVNV